MQGNTTTVSPLIPLGIGVALGGLGLLAVIELWPLIAVGLGLFLFIKGVNQ